MRGIVRVGVVLCSGALVACSKDQPAADSTAGSTTAAASATADKLGETAGFNIVVRSCTSPLYWIAANAGEDGGVIVNKVKEGKGNFGYNAATEEYGDMVEMGVIDPTKVTRLALQNAVSVAGLLLTTEAAVASMPEQSSNGTLRMPEGMNAMM